MRIWRKVTKINSKIESAKNSNTRSHLKLEKNERIEK